MSEGLGLTEGRRRGAPHHGNRPALVPWEQGRRRDPQAL